MKFTQYLVLVCGASALLILSSCNDPKPDSSSAQVNVPSPEETSPASLDQFEWMLGKWKQEEGENQVSYESWKRLENGDYLGHSCTLLEGDTVWQEVVDLYTKGDDIYMRVDQPQNPDPVAFKLAKSTSSSANFENPEHDFPQQIFYERDSDTTMHARIGGARQGQYAAKDFYMVLVK